MDKLQDRGRFFVEPGDEIYNGQIVGENVRPDDLGVNIVKAKQLTNMRQGDECIEITPKSIRLRKLILDENERKRREKSLASA